MNANEPKTKLTVLICTHNRSNLLLEAISSLNNAIRPETCEIEAFIVVNACTDNTLVLLKDYLINTKGKEALPLTYSIEPRAGKSFALNHAIGKIKDSFICFVDDDQKVDNMYFIEVINSIRNYPDAAILCGRLLPDWVGDEPSWIRDEGPYRIYPFPIPIFDLGPSPLLVSPEIELPPGGQVVIHSSVFETLGGFSEVLGPIGHNLMGSEDTEFFQRVLSAKRTIQYCPKIIQYHFVDKNRLKLTYLLAKCFQRNRSITITRSQGYEKPPLYLIKILINNIIGLLLPPINGSKLRFYLMRLFSTLGEIAGVAQVYLRKMK